MSDYRILKITDTVKGGNSIKYHVQKKIKAYSDLWESKHIANDENVAKNKLFELRLKYEAKKKYEVLEI